MPIDGSVEVARLLTFNFFLSIVFEEFVPAAQLVPPRRSNAFASLDDFIFQDPRCRRDVMPSSQDSVCRVALVTELVTCRFWVAPRHFTEPLHWREHADLRFICILLSDSSVELEPLPG